MYTFTKERYLTRAEDHRHCPLERLLLLGPLQSYLLQHEVQMEHSHRYDPPDRYHSVLFSFSIVVTSPLAWELAGPHQEGMMPLLAVPQRGDGTGGERRGGDTYLMI